MMDLTQQMLDDYRQYIGAKHWDDFVRSRLEESSPDCFGPVVNILEKRYSDDNTVEKKIYQREYELGTPYGFSLDFARATGGRFLSEPQSIKEGWVYLDHDIDDYAIKNGAPDWAFKEWERLTSPFDPDKDDEENLNPLLETKSLEKVAV